MAHTATLYVGTIWGESLGKLRVRRVFNKWRYLFQGPYNEGYSIVHSILRSLHKHIVATGKNRQ